MILLKYLNVFITNLKKSLSILHIASDHLVQKPSKQAALCTFKWFLESILGQIFH